MSEEEWNDTSTKLSKLSPKYSEASKVLKTRYLEIKQNIEIKQRVDKVSKNEISHSKNGARSVSKEHLIRINKSESQTLMSKQYKHHVKVLKTEESVSTGIEKTHKGLNDAQVGYE